MGPFEPESQILAQGLLAFPTYSESVLFAGDTTPFVTEDCAIWNVPTAADSVRQATISTIPTLVIAGSFDGKTSPQWAAYAARTLQNSTTVVIPGSGHWVAFGYGLPDDWESKPCVESVIASFLSNPTSTPDTSCVEDLEPPPFSTSATPLPPADLEQELEDFTFFEGAEN